MKVLITGGAGYIGSHTCLSLIKAGHEIAVLDNLSNCDGRAINNIKLLTNKEINFFQADIREEKVVSEIFREFRPDAVLHFAGLKSVSESTLRPLEYYDVNVVGTLHLLRAMQVSGCNNLIFSSSATVYGKANITPISEKQDVNPVNPYGWSKLFAERIIEDWTKSDTNFNAISLRYFNPIGADPSGLLGENPKSTPNNLMPIIVQVAAGEREVLSIFGTTYDTRDGTGERDYIHVSDLAKGHLLALNKCESIDGFSVFNLGTGQGTTVKELIADFERANDITIRTIEANKRPGDVACSVADVTLSEKVLGFRCDYDTRDACHHSWNWRKRTNDELFRLPSQRI